MKKYVALIKRAAALIDAEHDVISAQELLAFAEEIERAEPVAEVIPNHVGVEIAWCHPGRKLPVGSYLYPAPVAPAVPDKDTLMELFYRFHNDRYNPKSEHYRFEHFYKAMLSTSPGHDNRKCRHGEWCHLPCALCDSEIIGTDGGEMRLTVSYLSSFLNEINKSEDGDRDELLEYHLEKALQWLDAAMKEQRPTARR